MKHSSRRLLGLLCLCVAAVPAVGRAQTLRQPVLRPLDLAVEWQRSYDHGVTGHDSGAALALDGAGSVLIAGSSLGYTGAWTYEILTLKYSPAGVLLWEARYDNPGSGFNDRAVAVAETVDGGVCVLGDGPGSSGNSDIVILKYDAQGTRQWLARYDNGWQDVAVDLVEAADGSVYVTGSTLDNFTDIVLLKYSAGGVLQWTRLFHGGWGTDWPVGVALDAAGNVVVAGNSIQAPGGVNFDWVVLKYDPQGALSWSANVGGAARMPDYSAALHVDAAGRTVVTGKLVTSAGNEQFTTVVYSGAGQRLWLDSLADGTGSGRACVADAAGNVYVAGGNRTLSYDPQGVQRWMRFSTPPGAFPPSWSSIALDSAGRLLVSGSALLTTYKTDYALAAYSVRGDELAALIHGAASYDDPAAGALAVGQAGAIYLTGGSDNGHDQDALTVRYSLQP